MHEYDGHAVTDVSGFGLIGHAQNLVRKQRNEVSFFIYNLPIIAKLTAFDKATGKIYKLVQVGLR